LNKFSDSSTKIGENNSNNLKKLGFKKLNNTWVICPCVIKVRFTLSP
jgi:hypothetical protein